MLRWLAAASVLLLATVSHAQESTPPIGCQTGVDSAAMLNAPNLFRVAASCAEEGRAMEAAFALIAGQLRGTADMSSLKPSGEDDETKMVELYGFIYYRAGGTGTVELYRDPAQTERLFELIRQWQPQLPENYDPGWAYRQAPDKAKYFENLDYGRITRLLQLQHYALLARDDEYHAAQSEFAELQRKNPNGLSAGTADGDRAEYLMHAMQSASARIPEPRYPKPPKFEYVPDPDANFRQVYTGFNGLPEIETTIVMNRAEAEKAWWRTAIGEQAFGDLLAQADFEREMILVHTIGHRGAATGSVHLTDVRQRRDMNSISVSVMIGVNEEECEFKTADAYPFVVAVMARAEESPYVGGYSHSNFGDGCKQPKSAAPSKGAGQAP